MTFVITQACCNDAACVAVCPVQCIRPRPGDADFTTAEQLYIDPASCIDCSACEPVCPVDAISADYDLDPGDEIYLDINADYFADNPIETGSAPPPTHRSLPPGVDSIRVAIVGTGPSACYTAAELLRIDGVCVTMIDRLPTPYGLVRSGVAADHQQTKRATAQFRAMLARPDVTCLFNVEVGQDISLEELLEHHHAVIWAAGAQGDGRLAIPGEDLKGSMSAREVVAWYNGHPDHVDDMPDLSGERVVIIGNGNVALDVARTLASPPGTFSRTDLAQHALAAIDDSGVRDIMVVARRGPLDAAYTTSEILALSRREDLDLLARPAEVAVDDAGLSALRRRKLTILTAAAERTARPGLRSVTLRFGLTPVSINGTVAVESVTFARNTTVIENGHPIVTPTGETETVPATLVLRAIGYRALPADGLPFDVERGVIANVAGRVVDADGVIMAGRYCVGWAKRGATGVIGSNKLDAEETVTSLLEDLAAGSAPPIGELSHLHDLVRGRRPDIVDHAGWVRIDQAEQAAGRATGRPRLKLVTVDSLLSASCTTGRGAVV